MLSIVDMPNYDKLLCIVKWTKNVGVSNIKQLSKCANLNTDQIEIMQTLHIDCTRCGQFNAFVFRHLHEIKKHSYLYYNHCDKCIHFSRER